MTSSKSSRTNDLTRALTTGRPVTNGNHRIEVDFDAPRECEDCNRRLVCLAKGKSQCPPVLKVRFFYHNTCCLTYCSQKGIVTDHGYMGYSITTSRAVRWYLQALEHNNMILTKDVAGALRHFRKTSGEPFHLTQG